MFDWMNPRGNAPDAPSPDEPRMLALYKYDSCPYCQRVLRALKAHNITVEFRDIQTHREHRQQLQAKTGRTTVPCLFIDEVPLFESADIVTWLNAYAEAGHAG